MNDIQRQMMVNALRQQPQQLPQGALMNPMQGLSQVMNGGALGMALRQPQKPGLASLNPAAGVGYGMTGVPGS